MKRLQFSRVALLGYLIQLPVCIMGFSPTCYQSSRSAMPTSCYFDNWRPLISLHQHSKPSTALFMTPLATTTACLASDHIVAWSSMFILALQFGVMPTLQKKFVPKDLNRSSMVLAQEASKFALSTTCFFALLSPWQRQKILQGWSIRTWWKLAGIPATLYAIQNYAKLMAYQHLPPVTYSVLNQTKTLTAAFFCYTLLGIQQSPLQMMALLLLLLSALVIEDVVGVDDMWKKMGHWLQRLSQLFWRQRILTIRRKASRVCLFISIDTNLFDTLSNDSTSARVFRSSPAPLPATPPKDPYHFTRGVLPLLLANLTSGLAAALGQGVLQKKKRNLYLYGMELASASTLLVLVSLLVSKDGHRLQHEGISRYWTRRTWIPIGAHAVGGMLVGIVTKYAGSVQKGFALIFGVLLSGLFQKWWSHEPVTRQQVVGGALACISLWMHSSFPPQM